MTLNILCCHIIHKDHFKQQVKKKKIIIKSGGGGFIIFGLVKINYKQGGCNLWGSLAAGGWLFEVW